MTKNQLFYGERTKYFDPPPHSNRVLAAANSKLTLLGGLSLTLTSATNQLVDVVQEATCLNPSKTAMDLFFEILLYTSTISRLQTPCPATS